MPTGAILRNLYMSTHLWSKIATEDFIEIKEGTIASSMVHHYGTFILLIVTCPYIYIYIKFMSFLKNISLKNLKYYYEKILLVQTVPLQLRKDIYYRDYVLTKCTGL
ncbi:hypothetical protein ILUMI_23414 [Ignelater luminosus]|uniref:Uncharacterized protein n=1 Tax=Ignelater luminosus TaxID=2038154 RepID=A0A8K0FWY0_IGNLU|nr:hypothetical protein ILUMI_23414 [Ignelater luminosus]